MTIRSVHEITDDYEAWMRERLPFVLEEHLEYKYDVMAGRNGNEAGKRDRETAFRFLRATFYLWAYRLRERLPELVEDAGGYSCCRESARRDGTPIRGVHSRGVGTWNQLMAGSGGSQGFPSMAARTASSAVTPWVAAESR